MSRIRQRELHARRVRGKKLKKLREKYAKSKSAAQKDQILTKVSRQAPTLSKEEFEKMVKGEE